MNLEQIEQQSDECNKQQLNELRKQEAKNFEARNHKSLEIMPYQDESLIFRQQGKRVSWGKKKAKYVSARHYPDDECAKQIIDELVRLGCKRTMKEE